MRYGHMKTPWFLAALASFALAGSAFAYPVFELWGEGDDAPINVHSQPNSQAKIVATFPDRHQAEFEIIRQSGDWYLLRLNRGQGWVHKSQGRQGNIYVANGAGGSVNVRAEPSLQGRIYKTIANGEALLAFPISEYQFDDGIRPVKGWVGIYFDAAVTDVGAFIHESQLKPAPRPDKRLNKRPVQ